METISEALKDLAEGFSRRPLWMALAKEDVGDQHRRTALGPIWLLLNYLAFAGTFIAVFGSRVPDPTYPAYVAVGLFVWFYLMEVITQSVSLFIREESFIKGTTLPLTVYVMRLAVQSVIRSLYALVGCLAILLLAGTPVTVSWLFSTLSMVLIVAAAPAVIIVFGILGTFFADLQFMMPHLMRLGMFLTPVFWIHGGEGGIRGILSDWNPFTYFLDIVRVPILSGNIPIEAFAFCASVVVAVWCVAIMLLGRFRGQLVFYI